VCDGWPCTGRSGQVGRVSGDVGPSVGDVLYAYGGAAIALQGEFDMTGTDRFRSCVNEALATHPRSLIVDAYGLTFIDSSGLKALLHARAAATDAGVAFRVSEPSPALRWMAEVTGVEDLLDDE
jgi:anti-sigma B factor antagonist